MTHKNYYIESKMEAWFAETYELGNNLKKYLHQEKIDPNVPLTVDQAIGLIKIINAIDSQKLKVSRACIYARKNPDEFSETARATNKAISQAFRSIRAILYPGYESLARKTLETYTTSRKVQTRPFGFDGEVKFDDVPTKEELISLLRGHERTKLSSRYLARVRWKLAIAEVIKKNRIKNERWKDASETVNNYYSRVEEEVKTQVREVVHDQYGILLKQHESFMKWLSLFEEAILQAEGNISKLFDNLDGVANRKAKIIQMMLRASVSAALSPLFLQNFIDPTLTIFTDIISKLNLYKGDIDLNLSQTKTLYQMTGFLPDPDKRTYRDAYAKLSNETFYEKIERYKKYLQHKIDSLSETRELCDMMSDDSGLWGEYTADEIIHAHQMQMIDAGHYEKSNVRLKQPENENAMISAMVKPFETMIKNAFAPMQTQYGNKDSLKALCQFIDKITFNDNHVGPEAHRHFQNNALVKMMSNHVEIFFIVKYLVENSAYFGANSHNQQLHHEYFTINKNDIAFGLKADDASTAELVSTLLKRLMMIENRVLKKILELDANDRAENILIKNNPLMSSSVSDTTKHRLGKCLNGCFYSYQYEPSPKHIKRQQMIKAIIDEYYNQDISLLLQQQIVAFAKTQGVNLAEGSNHPDESSVVIEPKWLSENDLKNHVTEQIKPFIIQAEEQEQLRIHFGENGLTYYKNKMLVTDASNERAIEQTENNIAKQANRVIFKG